MNVNPTQIKNLDCENFQAIEGKDLFMVCFELNRSALSTLPSEYHFRTCRKDELDLWKKIHYDNPDEADQHFDSMTSYFSTVYAPQGALFFERCYFACDPSDTPIGTAFIWNAYNSFNTIHWVKVKKSFEGKGIGRALLSHIMGELSPTDFPIYLHTHPASFRAIKLYSDFGFQLITNPKIGQRINVLDAALPYLEQKMPAKLFSTLRMTEAPQTFVQLMETQRENEF